MKEIKASCITDAIESLCIQACCYLGDDIRKLLTQAEQNPEESSFGKDILHQILENARLAAQEEMPICQDTGMTVVFLEIGQDVHITQGDLTAAINEGVRRGYQKGCLRKSVLFPIDRINTKDNTPAVIHAEIVPGKHLKITVAPKGFGSENMSRLAMLKPSEGIEGIQDFILDTVTKAGANPCPPVIVGVGIGGTMEKCALLSKKALLREAGAPHPDPQIAALELKMLQMINKTGIGPQGLGGRCTALAVHIETYPTHIAGLPVAVNMQCHVARHKEMIL